MTSASLIMMSVLKIKNHNPRKGTETDNGLRTILEITLKVKNHNPRKGTETITSKKFFKFLSGV